LGLLVIGLVHDVRYKAVFKRLKRLEGELRLVGGGGGRPSPQPSPPRSPLRLGGWQLRKFCEIHVVMNSLALAAIVQWATLDAGLLFGRVYLAVLAASAAAVAAVTVLRGLQHEAAEREFAAWCAPPEGCTLEVQDGAWRVVACTEQD
jgi:hypothetical protein